MTRKLSLLCMNTLLNPENDDCGSTNYVQVNIENKKILGRLNGRWANDGLGNEFLIRKTDTDLIGKTVNLRSPITCCGHDGKICRKCYGELSKINDNIHVGILGCQFLTEQQTQKMLSAKHLLKTNSEKINWSEEFLELFNVSANSISLNPTLASVKAYSLVFHEDDINESGDSEFAKSVNKFWINNKSDTSLVECEKDLYISEFLESIIDFRGKKDDDGFITVTLSDEDIQNNEIFFYIEIENNELSKHLHDIINLIDQKDHLGATTMSEVLQKFLELVNDAGIHIDSVHLENIVREIIRRPDSITKRPDFTKSNPSYIIMRISDAIMNSPSITTSFAFEKLKKQIYEVETYEKDAESFLDALFK